MQSFSDDSQQIEQYKIALQGYAFALAQLADLYQNSDPEVLLDLQMKLRALEDKVTELGALEDVEGMLAEKNRVADELVAAQECLDRLLTDGEDERLRTELAALEAELIPLEKQNKLDALSLENQELQKQIAILEQRLQRQLNASQVREKAAATAIASLTEKEGQLKVQISALERQLTAAAIKLEEGDARFTEMKAHCGRLESQMSILATESVAKDAMIRDLTEQIVQLKAHIAEIERGFEERQKVFQAKLQACFDPESGQYAQGFTAGKSVGDERVREASALHAHLQAENAYLVSEVMGLRARLEFMGPPVAPTPFPAPFYYVAGRHYSHGPSQAPH